MQQPTQPAAPKQGQQKPQQRPQQKPQGAPQGRPAVAPQPKESENFRGIVRLAGKDIDGHLKIYKALLKVRGVGSNLAKILERVFAKELGIKPGTRVGDLTEEETDKIDVVLHNPQLSGIRGYSLNRQRDRDSGKDLHMLMNDLVFSVRQDIQSEKDIRSWKGWRHSIGQRVRGQHNRTTGRTGLTVGVLRKAIKEQKAAAAAGAQEKAGAPKK
ncbi:MAG: 30S ribosomal protein S13 [Candidatus Micrarchaeota archaeon]